MVKLISILFLILTFSINIEAEEDDKPSGGLIEEMVLGKAPSGDNSMYIFKTKRHVQVSVPSYKIQYLDIQDAVSRYKILYLYLL